MFDFLFTVRSASIQISDARFDVVVATLSCMVGDEKRSSRVKKRLRCWRRGESGSEKWSYCCSEKPSLQAAVVAR